jgi:hypothetical protein
MFTLFKFLLGIPFLIIGLIPNLIPAWFSHNLVKWLKLDSAYDTTIRLLSGVFIFFPLFWWLQTELFFAVFLPEIDDFGFFQTILLIIGYILSGMLAWRVYTEGSSFFNFQKFKRADADGSLSKLRQSVSDRLYFFWK